MGKLWALAKAQHGVIARRQLLEIGFSEKAIDHRLATGFVHPLWRGVYAVGRPGVTRLGRWMAAILACGRGAFLSHESAAALWEVVERESGLIHVTVPGDVFRRRPGVAVHRRTSVEPTDVTTRNGIPVTTPVATLIDLATLRHSRLEAAVNEADRLDLVDPERLRHGLDAHPGRHGCRRLRAMLDRRTFALTDSELERKFLPIVRRAELPPPLTRQWVNGFRVDFHWPQLGLVVETDGLRYHRTPGQQARDRLRDQAHTAAGLTPLRFTYAQIAFEPSYVQATLTTVAGRLDPAPAGG